MIQEDVSTHKPLARETEKDSEIPKKIEKKRQKTLFLFRKMSPTLLTVVFIFFTFLVDLGLVMEELFSLAGIYVFTTANCK